MGVASGEPCHAVGIVVRCVHGVGFHWRRVFMRRLHWGDARAKSSCAACVRDASRHTIKRVQRDTNDITFTVYCLDDARDARIVAENLAQPADAHVDAAIERTGVAAARELDELAARHHAIAVREQRGEHAILGAAQRRALPLRIAELARHDVELPAAEAKQRARVVAAGAPAPFARRRILRMRASNSREFTGFTR